ncbi:hypothetical protein EIN_282140, partial [Entamoeba invadens IP1]
MFRRNTTDKRPEEMSPQAKKQQKKEEEDRLLELFDRYDTEDRKEIDSYQISKYLQQQFKLYLPDYLIKQLIGEKVMSITSTKIQRKDWLGFCTILDAKYEELDQTKNFDHTQEIFASQRKEKPETYSDFSPKLVKSKRTPRTVVQKPVFSNGIITDVPVDSPQKDPKKRISSQESFCEQIFSPPMIVALPKKIHYTRLSLDDQTRDIIKQMNDEKVLKERSEGNMSLKSTLPGENEGTRRKQWGNLLRNFSEKPLEDTLDLMLGNTEEVLMNSKVKKCIYKVTTRISNVKVELKEKLSCVFAVYAKNILLEKITSDMYFDVNVEPPQIGFEIGSDHLREKGKKIYAVLFVYRAADAKQNTMREIYSGGELPKGKKLETLKQQSEFSHKTLIGIGAERLYVTTSKKNGYVLSPLEKQFGLKIYRDDEFKDLSKFLSDVESAKEIKATTLTWILQIEQLRDPLSKIKRRDSPRTSDFKIFDANLVEFKDQSEDMKELYLLEDVSYPTTASTAMTEFGMNYYIYPKELVMKEKRKIWTFIEVSMRTSDVDEKESESYISAFYPQKERGEFMRTYTTAVKLSGKAVRFNDEIKIRMPKTKEAYSELTEWHILFKVMEMQLDGTKMECRALGFMQPVLPQTNEYIVNLYKPGPSGYLAKTKETRGTLKVGITNLVSVVPAIKEIQMLGETSTGFINAVDKLSRSSLGTQKPVLQIYMPTMLNWMIGGLIGQKSLGVFVTFFRFALNLRNEVRDPLVLEYVNDFFDPRTLSSLYSHYKYVFLLIVGDTADLFMKNEANFDQNVVLWSWFFFDIIIRSTVEYLHEQMDKGSSLETCYVSAEGNRFEKSVFELVESFVHQVTRLPTVSAQIKANLYLGKFMRDLMRFWKLTFVVKLLEIVMDWYASGGNVKTDVKREKVTQILRVDMLNIFRDSSLLFLSSYIESTESFDERCFSQQTILTLMIRNYMMLILRGGELQKLGVYGLSLLVMRFDCDTTLQKREAKERLADMLMPIVIYMIEEIDFFKGWHQTNLVTLDVYDIYMMQCFVLCFLFVIKNLKTQTLRSYLKVPLRCSVLLDHFEWSLKIISMPISSVFSPIELFKVARTTLLKEVCDEKADNVFFTLNRDEKVVEELCDDELSKSPKPKSMISVSQVPKRPSLINNIGKTLKDTLSSSSSSS